MTTALPLPDSFSSMMPNAQLHALVKTISARNRQSHHP